MSANITVEVRDIYGRPTVYPVCEKAKIFAELIGSKTFTHRSMCKIEALGFTINVKQKAVDLKSIREGK